ncbi:helix-turn-helix transcriptional regulator [Tsukamurella hominis]|uniref:helix-turn-helix transcriptional regulator n=1 Tax=Tsukamurella hominis TaxID=1970232 RepID=UPI0039EC387B
MNHQWSWAVDAGALGQAVRSARLARQLQQADLAERLGVSRMTISRLERGGPVSVDTAVRALAECGAALAVVPKFARIEVASADE